MKTKPRFAKRKQSFASGGRIGGKAKRCWICTICDHWHDTMPGKKNGPRICTECGGLCRHFQSRAEATRFAELRLLQYNGLISQLVCQPKFALDIVGRHDVKFFGNYVADFQYEDHRDGKPALKIEDVKGGAMTEMSDFRRRLAEQLHGVTITLVKR